MTTQDLILNLLDTLTLHREELEQAFEQAELSGESLDTLILDLTAVANTQQETVTND